jgi:hypothetical protein
LTHNFPGLAKNTELAHELLVQVCRPEVRTFFGFLVEILARVNLCGGFAFLSLFVKLLLDTFVLEVRLLFVFVQILVIHLALAGSLRSASLALRVVSN